jgi:type II secretory ATPase GspE/PulE/Tfp pilus assembly ATPase PilB-like protein
MGVPPFLIAYTANLIVAQRLARKICPHCKKEYVLDEATAKELAKIFDTKQLTELLKKNIKDKTKLNTKTFYQGEGCARCGKTGYKGRLGIYEVMEIDEGLTKLINQQANANQIKEYARAHGMNTMFEDGLIKAKLGLTSIAEILRVTKE